MLALVLAPGLGLAVALVTAPVLVPVPVLMLAAVPVLLPSTHYQVDGILSGRNIDWMNY